MVVRSTASKHWIIYEMLGERRQAENAIDALADILRTFAMKNPNFLRALAPVIRGPKRNNIARTRADVYPHNHQLLAPAIEIVPDWPLETVIRNLDKMKPIKKACNLEGLTLGKDVVITLPNADQS